jgi:hypothetical protein
MSPTRGYGWALGVHAVCESFGLVQFFAADWISKVFGEERVISYH